LKIKRIDGEGEGNVNLAAEIDDQEEENTAM